MSWVAVAVGVGGAAVSAYGAKKQGDAAQAAAESVGKVDPRFEELIYGDGKDGKGLLNNAQDWYNANQSGLNPQMLQGMNQQWGVLNDPNLRNGYNNMANMGASLMNAPVAGNPFTDGRNTLNPSYGTQMAPGLINSTIQNTGPQAIGQAPQQNKPLPVAFGSDTGTPGGLLSAGPFTAPAPVAPPVAPAPVAAATGATGNLPFNMADFQQDFYKKLANDELTAEDIARFNNLANQNAG